MKVCDVVLNSIWYDPRVRKQIVEYKNNFIDLSCVGYQCGRYDEEKVKGIPCPTIITTIPPKFNKSSTILQKIKKEKARAKSIKDAIVSLNPEIIHANDILALIPAYMAKKKLKCKLIYDSHEVNVGNYIGKRQNLMAFIMERIERYIIKRTDAMICVSNAAADYFQKKYKMKKRPMVITNCALKSETDLDEVVKCEKFEVLNHGIFGAARGYDLMVDSCKYLKEYPEINLAIRGFGKLEPTLREQVEKEKLDNFTFYPPVNVEQLIPEATKSHVGVAITEPICLNFKLSVSNKLFEYAAAGLPVIMSDIPEHRYLNDKYHFGIVLEKNTSECFAEAVIKLYKDKEFYSQCAKNAKKLSNEVNWENEFAKLIKLEKELLNGKE